MRRILLGGLGLALGAFAPPALAQQPTRAAPPARTAGLGRPTAVPEPQPEPEITQTGLLRSSPPRPTVAYSPTQFGAPATTAAPTAGAPVTGAPTYAPPTYATPTYGAPTPGAPTYATPTYGAPTYGPPVYSTPTYGGPVYGAPVVGGGDGQPPAGQLNPPRVVTTPPPSVTESRGDPTGRIPVGPAPAATYVPSVLPDAIDCPPGFEDPLVIGGGMPATPVAGPDRVARIGRGWVSAEMLLWWSRGQTVPPLVTTGTTGFGILGQPDTRVLLGGSFGQTFQPGGRIGAGYWFGDGECRGVDARLFWVSPATTSFLATTNQYPLLARPFENVNPGISTANVGPGQSAEIVARPGVATGSVAATLKSTVWGAEANYRRYLAGGPGLRVDGLVGYRFLDLREQLMVTERFARTPDSDLTVGVPAVSGMVTDSFRTANTFNGGQIGLVGTMQRGRWSIDPRATVAFGTVHQSVDIYGSQALTFANGLTTVTPGGLLAVPGANIGHFNRDKFAVVPEVGLNIGWQATQRLKLFVGYNFLYLSSAVRPGDAIDTRVDAARVPNLLPPGSGDPLATGVRPVPQFHSTGYFIQGISFGAAFRW